MTREHLKPKNEAHWLSMRLGDVTSTESAALFGQSPYETAFELWHRKRARQEKAFEETERTAWGKRLQDSIALGVAADFGVSVVRQDDYIRIPGARMGSSFDFEVTGLSGALVTGERGILSHMFTQHGRGLMEIKNVDRLVFRDQWAAGEDGYIEAPAHIEVQLQHQLHVRDVAWGAICALVGGNTVRVIVRERMADVGRSLEAKIQKFWESVELDQPPPPVYPEDAGFVASLYGYAEPGKVFDGRGNADLAELAGHYCAAAEREKLAKEDKEVARAKLLEQIGDAERALLDGYTISAAMVAPTRVEYDRAGYRGWRVTPKKPKP